MDNAEWSGKSTLTTQVKLVLDLLFPLLEWRLLAFKTNQITQFSSITFHCGAESQVFSIYTSLFIYWGLNWIPENSYRAKFTIWHMVHIPFICDQKIKDRTQVKEITPVRNENLLNIAD